jgi:DNA-binding FadR family transcriptional regulator
MQFPLPGSPPNWSYQLTSRRNAPILTDESPKEDLMFKPVKKKSLADAVFEQLRDQIVRGELEPGSSLPAERLLSEKLEVNRGAVREALKRLEQARLVSRRHGGATRVLDYRETAGTDLLGALLMRADGSINTKVARSVMEMRSAIAADMARLCARRGDEKIVNALGDVLERMEAVEDDPHALSELDLEFWGTLLEGADNVAYQLAFNSLRETYDKFRGILAGFLVEELSDLEARRAILAAVRDGREEAAEERARKLMTMGETLIGELMNSLNEEERRNGEPHGNE